MKNLLIPIDGTERSINGLTSIGSIFKADEAKITLLMVREDIDDLRSEIDFQSAKKEMLIELQKAKSVLHGFSIKTIPILGGRAEEEILNYAEQNKIDFIVMMKSTKIGWVRMIGSVTNHIIKYAKCSVVIIPE